jgi:hypothetical protein
MNRNRLIVLIVSACCVLYLIGNIAMSRRVRAQAPVRPFVLEYVENPGNPTTSRRVYYAVRSDGSTAIGPADPQSTASRSISYTSPTRMSILIHDPTRAVSTRYYPPGRNIGVEGCPGSGLVAEETLLGVRVSHFSETSQSTPTLTARWDTWRAKELQCVALQTVVVFTDTGTGNVSRDEKIPISLLFGEPAEALFQRPAGYVELPPSQFFETMFRADVRRREGERAAATRPLPDKAKKSWAAMDQVYYRNQQFKPR